MDVKLPARRSAADQYRDAFERLKLNRPQLLPRETLKKTSKSGEIRLSHELNG